MKLSRAASYLHVWWRAARLARVRAFKCTSTDSDAYQRQLTICYRQNLRSSRLLNPTSTSSEPFQEIQRPTSVTHERGSRSLKPARSNRTLSSEVEQGTESNSEASLKVFPLVTDQNGPGTVKLSEGRSLLAIIALTTCGASSLLPVSNETTDRKAEPITSTEAYGNVHPILAEKPGAAGQILLGILSCPKNLRDLLALAYINRGFYITYRKNQLTLVAGMLQSMTPAASGTRQFSLSRSRLSRLENRRSQENPISIMKLGFGPRSENDSQLMKEFGSYLCAGCGLTDVHRGNVNKVSNEAQNRVSLRKLYVSQRLKRIVPAESSRLISNEASDDFTRESASFISSHKLETRRTQGESDEDREIDQYKSKKKS